MSPEHVEEGIQLLIFDQYSSCLAVAEENTSITARIVTFGARLLTISHTFSSKNILILFLRLAHRPAANKVNYIAST